jgi:predicted phosphodiesterase
VVFEANGILFMNPGSISIPKGSIAAVSYGVIDISEDGGGIAASVVAKIGGLWQPIITG